MPSTKLKLLLLPIASVLALCHFKHTSTAAEKQSTPQILHSSTISPENFETIHSDCVQLNAIQQPHPVCLPLVNYGTGSSTMLLGNVTELVKTWLNPSGVNGVGVDTAFVYGDQPQVGKAIRESPRSRESVVLTTKVKCAGEQVAQQETKMNLERLNTLYVDLLLIHNRHQCNSSSTTGKSLLGETWKVLMAEQDAGRAHALGVSNFVATDLLELEQIVLDAQENALVSSGLSHNLLRKNDNVSAKTQRPRLPTVNQIPLHVGCLPSKEVLEYCARTGMILEAYSPLAKGRVLHNPTVIEVAKKYGKSAAQVGIQFLLQQGFAVVFTSSKEKYMKENLSVSSESEKFTLSDSDMKLLMHVDTIGCAATIVSKGKKAVSAWQ